MLDERTGILLHKLNELCAGGGFRIVEEDELISYFTGKNGAGGEDVRAMLEYLRTGGFVDLQYAEEGVYCVRTLPEARRYEEDVRESRRAETRSRRTGLLFSAVGGFLGALLGAAVVLAVSFAL